MLARDERTPAERMNKVAKRALGMIETLGLVGAVEAADAASKAASVQLVEIEYADAGICTVKVLGEVADVLSSVDAGSNAAQRVGQLLGRHVIPQPDDDTEKLIPSKQEQSEASGAYDVLSESSVRLRQSSPSSRKARTGSKKKK